MVGCSYTGLPTRRADVRNVIGAAMAFRREAFTLAGTFSDLVGRVGTTPTGCEETELCIRLRKAKGLTQELLADLAGVHPVFISFLETGKRNITLDYLDKIASALGCNSFDLIKP